MTAFASLPDFLCAPATAKVLDALPGSRAVGGAVRDALAGLPVADVDVAAPFPPEEIMARLPGNAANTLAVAGAVRNAGSCFRRCSVALIGAVPYGLA